VSANTPDPVMERVRDAFKASGLTFEQLGKAMGYEGGTARKSAWQFIDKTNDPRVSMLRRFAKAISISLEELISEQAPAKRKK
jgi:transcriptional regulator with XRE-family HTH domain